MIINVTRSSMPDYDEYCDEIKDIWDSHWLTNMGIKHKKLQSELEKYLGVTHVTLYTNGHLALENAIASFGFKPGSEVITTPFTFVSTTHAIVRSGLVPVFADINPETYTMAADKIEKLITDKTVAIVPVHVYGNMCDTEKIKNIADRHNLRVIYDAAHAFGVRYMGKSSASFGDISMFSFHATKVFNTIEGGALCYADDNKVTLLNDLKNFGIHGQEEIIDIGGNAKMNEFQAAMGICNLRHLEREIGKRKLVYDKYTELLSGINGIKLCHAQENVTPNYAYFPIVFDGYKYTRDEIFDKLKFNEIIARKYFYPAINETAAYKDYRKGDTPIAARLARCVLTLPMYSDLPLDDVERICDIITK